MDEQPRTFLGLDLGESLALIGEWAAPALPLDRLDTAWPLRERPTRLSVFAGDARRSAAHAALAAGARGGPACVVAMSGTALESACGWANRAGARWVLRPACGCALWSEGVTVASVIREYHRLVPPARGLNLDVIRDQFVDMMEEAAEFVQQVRLDQDDALLDRFADLALRGRDEVLTVPVESLCDSERLLAPARAAWGRLRSGGDPVGEIEVRTLHMRCLVSTVYPVPRPDPFTSGPDESSPPGWIPTVLPARHTLYRSESSSIPPRG